MEVRIGVTDVAREVVFESNQSPDEVAGAVEQALAEQTALDLTDERGHRVIVPSGKLGYIDIGPGKNRKVGFGS